MTAVPADWLLGSSEPWTRYRMLTDLLGRSGGDPEVTAARAALVDHPQVQALDAAAAGWPSPTIKRHNDAAHPLYALSTLADFGLCVDDLRLGVAVEAVLAHASPEGAFQSLVQIPPAFGGTGEETWAWMACDAPTLLYALLALGVRKDPRVGRAVEHLASLVQKNGWRCAASSAVGKFRGPGRKTDPCPVANVYALKVLAQVPELTDSPAAHAGTEMLLRHWERRDRPYLFGVGTGFLKLKYPFVWYDLLHVMDILSRFPFVYADPRFREMIDALAAQADRDGRFTAGSMYQAWKGWPFADKKNPSPWLTFLAWRILQRAM